MIEDNIHFDGPGIYKILTKEALSPEIFEMYSLLEMEDSRARSSHKKQLLLNIKDQSELMGFLNMLYQLHYTILRVELVSIAESDQAETD